MSGTQGPGGRFHSGPDTGHSRWSDKLRARWDNFFDGRAQRDAILYDEHDDLARIIVPARHSEVEVNRVQVTAPAEGVEREEAPMKNGVCVGCGYVGLCVDNGAGLMCITGGCAYLPPPAAAAPRDDLDARRREAADRYLREGHGEGGRQAMTSDVKDRLRAVVAAARALLAADPDRSEADLARELAEACDAAEAVFGKGGTPAGGYGESVRGAMTTLLALALGVAFCLAFIDEMGSTLALLLLWPFAAAEAVVEGRGAVAATREILGAVRETWTEALAGMGLL